MTSGMWMIIGWSVFVILTGVLLFLWGWRRGQFKNVEDPKYRMLDDKEPEPWSDEKGESNNG